MNTGNALLFSPHTLQVCCLNEFGFWLLHRWNPCTCPSSNNQLSVYSDAFIRFETICAQNLREIRRSSSCIILSQDLDWLPAPLISASMYKMTGRSLTYEPSSGKFQVSCLTAPSCPTPTTQSTHYDGQSYTTNHHRRDIQAMSKARSSVMMYAIVADRWFRVLIDFAFYWLGRWGQYRTNPYCN